MDHSDNYQTVKGFDILNLKTLESEFVENTISPKFYKVYLSEIDARRQQADNDFQYDTVDTSKRFEAGKYENTANAEQTAQRATLAKQIAELLTQFQSVGGKIPKVGIQTLVNYLNSIQ